MSILFSHIENINYYSSYSVLLLKDHILPYFDVWLSVSKVNLKFICFSHSLLGDTMLANSLEANCNNRRNSRKLPNYWLPESIVLYSKTSWDTFVGFNFNDPETHFNDSSIFKDVLHRQESQISMMLNENLACPSLIKYCSY